MAGSLYRDLSIRRLLFRLYLRLHIVLLGARMKRKGSPPLLLSRSGVASLVGQAHRLPGAWKASHYFTFAAAAIIFSSSAIPAVSWASPFESPCVCSTETSGPMPVCQR